MSIQRFFIIVLLCGILVGCASSSGSHKLLTPSFSSDQISKYSSLQIVVSSKGDAQVSQLDKNRISDQIVKDIQEDAPSRFEVLNQASPNVPTLEASVEIKRYDEGDAFARFMLAGLGQIHIDADVILSDLVTKERFAQYEVTKTFAWGGIYGGFTGIKEVEAGFCKAVSDSILGKD